MNSREKYHNRGTIYLLVLVGASITAVIGLLSFRMLQAQATIAKATEDRLQATMFAESAVQVGLHGVKTNDKWRETFVSGVPGSAKAIGTGIMRITITDDDGDLANGDEDTFTITGSARVSNAIQMQSAAFDYIPSGTHAVLARSLTVGGELLYNGKGITLEDGGLAQTIQWTGVSNATASGIKVAATVDIPSASLIADWAGLGTVITIDQHGGQIRGAVLSPSLAPFGIAPDPDGIYVIDGGGSSVTFESNTVSGTVIFINIGNSPVLVKECSLAMGGHGGPTLIVEGNLELNHTSGAGVHQGLIYCTGNLRIRDWFMLVGAVICGGNAEFQTDYISVNAHPSATAGPPQGFHESTQLQVIDGSWARVVH